MDGSLSPQPSHNFPFTREIAKPLRPTERRAPFVRVLVRALAFGITGITPSTIRTATAGALRGPRGRALGVEIDPEFCATRRCKLILKEPHHARGLSP